jgi:hypothetical protein
MANGSKASNSENSYAGKSRESYQNPAVVRRNARRTIRRG